MNESEQKNLGCSQVVISGAMTIFTARAWRDELLTAAEAPGDVELDLSAVSDIDAAGIELLVLLRLEAAVADRGFHVRTISGRVREAFEFCRLMSFFELAVPVEA